MITKLILLGILLACSQIAASQSNLLTAIQSGDVYAVKAHVESSKEVNHIIEAEGTLLQIALISKQGELARYLINAGADTNLTSQANDQPPLTLAIRLDDLEFLSFLLNNGANIDGEDREGRTPLFKTLKPDRPAARTLLIENGVDVNKSLKSGMTVVIEALADVNIGAVKQLVASNASIDGKLIDETACARCHNPKGVLKYPFSLHLGGQNAAYTKKQLNDFRNKTRTNFRMDRLSDVFIDEVNVALADYYETLPRYRSKSTATAEVVAKGKQLFDEQCSSCHGSDGITTDNDLTPVLAGMTSTYVNNQLKTYKSGERSNDLDSVMRKISTELTREQIFAVSEYIHIL